MQNLFFARFIRLAALVLGLIVCRPAAGVQAQAPAWQWGHSPAAGTGDATAVDSAGNVYVLGTFTDTATFGATRLISVGSYGHFVAKISPAGVWQWTRQVAGGESIGVDRGGNVLLMGRFDSTAAFGATTLTNPDTTAADLFVAKLSPAGAWLWAVRAGSTGDEFSTGLAADRQGNVYVAGSFRGTTLQLGAIALANANAAGTSVDLFVAKLSPAGAWLWGVRAGGASPDACEALAVDAAGNAYLTGAISSPTVAFGATTLTDATIFSELFVAKLSPAGVWQWATQADGRGATYGNRVKLDGAGNLLIAGTFYVPCTIGTSALSTTNSFGALFVAKLSPTGAWVWVTAADGGDEVGLPALVVDAAGRATVSGYYTGPADIRFGATTLADNGTYNGFVAQISAAGAWLWATLVGGASADEAVTSLAIGPDGAVCVTGLFLGDSLTLGPVRLTSPPGATSTDGYVFVARLAPPLGIGADEANAGNATIRLYPNPAHETVRLMGTAGTTATLLDGCGRTVRTVKLPAGSATLDVRGLPAGVYTVRVGAATRRLVVE